MAVHLRAVSSRTETKTRISIVYTALPNTGHLFLLKLRNTTNTFLSSLCSYIVIPISAKTPTQPSVTKPTALQYTVRRITPSLFLKRDTRPRCSELLIGLPLPIIYFHLNPLHDQGIEARSFILCQWYSRTGQKPVLPSDVLCSLFVRLAPVPQPKQRFGLGF
jgi:hypothetical protein